MIFWIPILASAVLLFVLWSTDEFSRGQALLFLLWCMGAGFLQFVAGSISAWVIGLVSQVILAIYLSIRWKTSM
jgi:hypothetical protein